MASTGTATAASTRQIIGPAFTSAGFQYWYLDCRPDCIVAVPQGPFVGLLMGMSHSVAPHFGLLGGLVVGLMRGRAQVLCQKAIATIESAPTSRLRMKPNQVYLLSQLRSIQLKPAKFGKGIGLVTPDITVELKNGRKQKYGMQGPDFEQACVKLKQLYPELCKTV